MPDREQVICAERDVPRRMQAPQARLRDPGPPAKRHGLALRWSHARVGKFALRWSGSLPAEKCKLISATKLIKKLAHKFSSL
jgi:hypothetical protein